MTASTCGSVNWFNGFSLIILFNRFIVTRIKRMI